MIFAQNIAIMYDIVCASSPTHLTGVTDINESDIVSYNWDFGNNGTFEATGKEVIYSNQSNNAVRLVISTSTGSYTHVQNILFYNLPVALFALPNGCEGEAFTFYDYSFSSDGEIVKYDWDFNSDGITDSGIEGNARYIFPDHGIFRSTLKVETEHGCSSEYTKTILVMEKPKASFSISNTCLGDSTVFKNNSVFIQDSVKHIMWEFGDRNSKESFSREISHLYNSEGSFSAGLGIEYKNGCADNYKQNIQILPQLEFQLSFSPDTIIYVDKPVLVRLNEQYDSISWSTGETTEEISILNPGYYSVRVVSGFCIHSEKFNIVQQEILPEFRLESTVLTLNGDGINDRLLIQNFGAFGKCQIKVYNSRGLLIYSNKDYQNDWDLQVNGKFLESGGYFYEVKSDSGIFRGSFSVLK